MPYHLVIFLSFSILGASVHGADELSDVPAEQAVDIGVEAVEDVADPGAQILQPRTYRERLADDRVIAEGKEVQSLTTRLGFWLIAFSLIGAGFVWLRKRGLFAVPGEIISKKQIKIEEMTGLGNRQFLVLAKVRGQSVLLGVGPGFIHLLKDMPASEVQEPAVRESEDFADHLRGKGDSDG